MLIMLWMFVCYDWKIKEKKNNFLKCLKYKEELTTIAHMQLVTDLNVHVEKYFKWNLGQIYSVN